MLRNVRMVWNFEVTSGKFQVLEVCISGFMHRSKTLNCILINL